MSPIEIAMQLQRKHIILGAGIVFCGLWLCLVAYFLFGEKTPAPVNPGAVAVRSASPVATLNAPTVSVKAPRSSVAPMLHHSAPAYSFVTAPTAPSVGSGGGSGSIATTSGGSSSRGIKYTSIAYSGTIYVPTKNNAITAVGATTAGDVASQRIGAPRRATKTEDGVLPGYNEDPVPDEVEQPIGDVAWGWMLLLTIGWCVRVRLRKQ